MSACSWMFIGEEFSLICLEWLSHHLLVLSVLKVGHEHYWIISTQLLICGTHVIFIVDISTDFFLLILVTLSLLYLQTIREGIT